MSPDPKPSHHILDAIMSIIVWIILIAIAITLGSIALVWAIIDSIITIIFKRDPVRLCWV